ncbi:DUF4276 family protein [Polyangium aurulentum]|uniref:DUF4276 family protein n=1 Tax=Polyangium aurulentum TaxID=2567896 RepID=UPI0010AE0919|nr:DUF4276 family protein [Polyangium aurulentum]UQA58905.1 DUF4276 family protein [Polyangium aurulentum]
MGKAFLVVEGHGEVAAAGNLVTRLCADLGLSLLWGKLMRAKGLERREGILDMCNRLRALDCEHALFLRDEDDGCPAQNGPGTAAWLSEAQLPFPAAVVLAHREYEAWFLPCLHLMAGKPLRDERGIERQGIVAGARFEGDPEAVRGVKERLRQYLPPGRSYKPALDQLPLTRMIDFATLRASGMPSFATLENALRFLSQGQPGEVYPPPRAGA